MLAEKAQELMLGLDFTNDYHTISKSFLKPIAEIACFRTATLWHKREDPILSAEGRWRFLSSESPDPDVDLLKKIILKYESLPVGRWVHIQEILFDRSFMVISLCSDLIMTLELSEEKLPGTVSDINNFVKALSFFGKFLSEKIRQDYQKNQFDELLLIKKLYKQAKEEAEEKEKLFRLVAENTKDLILLHQPNGDIVFASPSVENLLGYKVVDLFSLALSDLIHEGDWANLRKNFRWATENEKNIDNVEFRAKRKDGTHFWVESSIKPIYDDEGKLTQFQTISRDITKRKEDEKLILEAKKKAEEANAAKSEFLSTMSHEIRTPMNAVIGLSHLLMQENPRPDQLNSLRTLHFSAENLLSLINDILDYSKIEAGKISLENREYNLYELVDGIHQTFQPKASDKDVVFRLQWDRQIPRRIIGDQVRLSQILNNLISNALKFTEKGRVVLQIDLLEQMEEEVKLYFAVKDTGIGIPEEKQEAIFSRFSQAAESTTRRFGGTGLGLAITKNLLELQGSQIQLRSAEGEGSCFFFEISFKTVHEDAESTRQVIQKRLESDELEGLKVLVAEDNAVNRMIVERFLKRWGILGTFVGNGEEAVEKVSEETFDLVLMDIHMPVMDGLKASHEIRNTLNVPSEDLPIVALTASTLAEDRLEAEHAGMDGYIAKPFDPYDLFQKIYRFGKIRDHRDLIYR